MAGIVVRHLGTLFLLTCLGMLVRLASCTYPLQRLKTEVLWRLRWRSTLPQFILDTDNPWLKDPANKAHLMSLPDPVGALCSLSSPLRPSVATGSADDKVQYDENFFEWVRIDNNRAGVDRPGWKNARARIEEILACPAALADVKKFEVTVYVSDGKYGIGHAESPKPPTDLPDLFVRALSQMPNLKVLSWNTFGNGNDEFRSAFLNSDLQLPQVKELTPAIFTEWWADICPGVERLSSGSSIGTANYWRWTSADIDGRRLFVDSTRKLENLSSFSMTGEWEMEHPEALIEASPQLTELSIFGGFVDMHSWGEADPNVLRSWIEVVSRFRKLEKLHLPASWELGLGFDGGPDCGNAYFGRAGREYGRQVSQQQAETTEEAAAIVLAILPNLKALTIGGYCPELTKDGNNTVAGGWPWSKNMTEWTHSIWPEREDREEL